MLYYNVLFFCFSGSNPFLAATGQPGIRVFPDILRGPDARQPEVRVSQQEIEVTMEPIVVGIEMGPEITINASGNRAGGGNIPDNDIQVS